MTLPVAAAFSAAPALAQNYPSPPPGYYRTAPPPGAYYDDRRSPPAFWNDDDEDDRPAPRRYRSPQMTQGQPGAPSRILPYPEEAQATPPPPAFVPPDARAPAARDPDAVRPPGAIAVAPAGAPPPAAPATPAPAGTAALPPEDQPEQGQPQDLPDNLKRQLVDYGAGAGRHHYCRYRAHLPLSGARRRQGDALRRARRPRRFHLDRHRAHFQDEGMAGLVPAAGDDRAPALSAAPDGGRTGQSARRARYVSRQHALPHSRHQPAVDHRPLRFVGLRRHAQRRRRGSLQPGQVGTRVVVLPGKAPETVAATGAGSAPPPANPMAPPPHNGTAISGSPLPPPR